MKKLSNIISKFYQNIKSVNIVDRYLILIMAILLLQSGANLLFGLSQEGLTNTIDIVIRGTISSIFGYFLSANFIKDENSKIENLGKGESQVTIQPLSFSQNEESSPEIPKNSIGFTPNDIANKDISAGKVDEKISAPSPFQSKYLQVHIISCIAVSSLIILLIGRNFVDIQSSALTTLAQLRDLIAGSIGFLIGTVIDVKKKD